MRGHWRLASSALAAALFVHTSKASRDWEEEEGGKNRNCSPQSKIFQLVLGLDEADHVEDGAPQVTLKSEEKEAFSGLPEGCKKWVGQQTCCKAKLFNLVRDESRDEEDRFNAIRDVYAHLSEDVIQPAIDDLSSHSEGDVAKQLTDVSTMLREARISEAMTAYINGCEDPIRHHFAATTCALCNPDVKLLEGKYLEVNTESCKTIWTPCSKAATVLDAVAGKLKAAVDAGVKNDKLVFAHKWLSGAAHQVAGGVKRIEFYKDEDKFCNRIQDKGYAYDPEDWGNLDTLHPGLADHFIAQEEEQKKKEELAKRGTEALADITCVHGWVRGSFCICYPCWEGASCENPAPAGPMRFQPFTPLVAEDVGSQQPLGLVGCQMPTDLATQLSRIKLLKVKSNRGKLSREEAHAQEDPCPKRARTLGAFQELPLQIPVSATETRLEYLVQVPLGSEGLYAVCYCAGAECLNSNDDWWRTGYIKVVRTDGQVDEEEKAEIARAEEDPLTEEAKSGPPLCSTQWKKLPMLSVSFTDFVGKDGVTKVAFECKKGYSDLAGPLVVTCTDGMWKAKLSVEEDPAKEEDEEWDGRLPRCRWGYRQCKSPQDSHIPGGGALQVEDGIAKYTCPFATRMQVDATHLKLKNNQRVVSKAANLKGVVVRGASGNSDIYTVKWHSEGAAKNATTEQVKASDVWMVVKEGYIRSYCQENKHWAPVFSARCVQSDVAKKGVSSWASSADHGSSFGDTRAVAVTNSGKAVVASMNPRVAVSSSVNSASGMHCGGSFGRPEVNQGQAASLIEAFFSSHAGPRSLTDSMLELREVDSHSSFMELDWGDEEGAPSRPQASQEASLLELGGGGGASEAQVAVHTPRRTSSSSRLVSNSMGSARRKSYINMLLEGGQRQRIRKWPVRFTRDAARSFLVDKCWTTVDCSKPGKVQDPEQLEKEEHELRWLYYHWGIGLVVAGVVLAFLSFCCPSICAAKSAKRLDKDVVKSSLAN